jgi:hypothetical protein
MNFPSNSTGYKTNDFFPIELKVSFDHIPKGENQLAMAQFKTLNQSRMEIRFEIDQALPPGSNIAIKMAKKSPDQKTLGEVYKVHRGRIQYCHELKGSQGSRYEVCVRIIETVIQTEIQSSRFNFT